MGPTPTEVAPKATSVHEPVPELAGGVELLGALESSGYKEPPCLARRRDGQTIQLTDLLYRVLEAIDGRRDHEAIAAAVGQRIGRKASADDVRFLVEEKLRPLGLLKRPDGSDPEVAKANPLLALRLRVVLADERTTRRVTAPFAALFPAPVVAAVVAGFAAVVAWLLFSEGIGASTRQAIYEPGLLVLVFALVAASAGFHEFGHAAALRYGGGTPGVMGAGLYLVWPAFYTDVTDSYRLPRRARLRTDLGGLYFNMVFALGLFGLWAFSGFDALLLVLPLLLLQMVQQLLPFVRLDGYHILADLTGVPDLFARIRPTLASLRPGRAPDPRVTALKPWVRAVITLWVLAVVPLLLLSLLFAVATLPRVAATAWDSLALQRRALSAGWADGDALAVAAGALSVVALVLPALSTGYLLGRVGTRGGRAAWRATQGRPAARLAVGAGAVAALGALALVLWPNGEYRPFQPGERARLQETVAAARDLPAGRPALGARQAAELEGAPFVSADPEARPGDALAVPPAPADPAPADATVTTTAPPAVDRGTVATTGTTRATASAGDEAGAPPTTAATTTTTGAATTTSMATTTTSPPPTTDPPATTIPEPIQP